MSIKEKLETMRRNSIVLKIAKKEKYIKCATRFGGQPDVQSDFVWHTFEGESYDGVVKDRPLTFIAQFNCADLAPYDTEHLLPDHGLLSFFYETDVQPWGYNPKDKGGARVYWFEDLSKLSAADFPVDMEEDFKFPMIKIKVSNQISLPGWEDFTEKYIGETDDDDEFEEIREKLGVEEPDECSKMLGWADTIQGSMPIECELIQRGYYLGDGWKNIPEEVRKQAKEKALDRWILLFQLDMVECGDFELMFGDSGRIYYYITKEDLLARRFDRVWLMLQCC